MTDFKLGFHPLTPIYALLSSYYNIIGEKSQTDPFFYTYFTYINVLEKMKKVLEEKYLDNTTDSTKTASAYMIGLGLYNMLFASHTSILQHNTILSVINMNQKEYSSGVGRSRLECARDAASCRPPLSISNTMRCGWPLRPLDSTIDGLLWQPHDP